MNNYSKLLSLNARDAVIGLVMAVLGAVLTLVYQTLLNGGQIDLKAIGLAALTSGLAYILKNWLSDSSGKLGRVL